MSRKQEKYSVLLDTSFFCRLLSKSDPLHENAKGYFRYFLDNGIDMMVSTISIAEYCVRGEVSELPLRHIKIIPFNFNHSTVAGALARILFDAKHQGVYSPDNRLIIPNDSKLFAQALSDANIRYFVTSDEKCASVLKMYSSVQNLTFDHMNIAIPHSTVFGLIDFED